MSAASDTLESALAGLIFHNIPFAGLGDAIGIPGSAAAGDLYISLHTADPGEAGTQSTSESAYAGYARVAVARSAAGWVLAGGLFENAATVQFPACTGGTSTVTHVGIGTAEAGAGNLLLRSGFSDPASLTITTGIAPKFDAGEINGSVA